MKVAIIGSRSFENFSLMEEILKNVDIDLIVSGGAKGADSLGEKYAVKNNIKTKIFLPNWNKFGRAAGMIRNKDIIENCDCVYAFWDGTSKGTKNSIDKAKKLNKKTIIIRI